MMENSIEVLHCLFKVQERSTSMPYNQDHAHRTTFSSRYVSDLHIQITHNLLSREKLKFIYLTLSLV